MRPAWQNGVVYLLAVLAALALKQHYSTASVEDLRWILASTAAVVAGVSGTSFVFEEHTGYVSRDLHFVIAESCAGVNFLIIAFWTAIFAYTRETRTRLQQALLLIAGAGLAYVAAVAANSLRILIALPLHLNAVSWGVLTPERIHRIEGIVVYLAVLCAFFASSRWVLCVSPR